MYNILENKIINYINQTPENTNPSVLATLLGELKVPKPLTYDYMPEGYPSKVVQAETLMEEQELAFEVDEYVRIATLPNPIEIIEGQTYTVNWDGTEYKCVGFTIDEDKCGFGNLYLLKVGDDTGEPFSYTYNKTYAIGGFMTSDISASHTINVKKIEETVTPIAEEFMPVIPSDKMPTVPYLLINSSTTNSTKVFKLTVDDSGAISATEVTS